MTGICFTRLSGAIGQDRADDVAADVAAVSARYEAEPVWTGDSLVLYDISYPSYPVTTVHVGDATVIVEGHIYDCDDLDACAAFVETHVSEGSVDESLADWVGDRDGEFVIYHVDDGGRLTVVSDVLGRLPLYHTRGEAPVAAGGRSLEFSKGILEATDHEISIDRPALAQTLLLNYPLGDRTLLAEIAKTGPAAVLEVAPEGVSATDSVEFDLERVRSDDRSMVDHAAAVTDRIRNTCRRRATLDGQHVVSLSGGLDSRTIAAGLDAVDCDFAAASFSRPARETRSDVRVALEVAQELGIEYTVFPVENTGADMVELLHRTGGLNYLAMGFLVDYYRRLLSRFSGPVQHYTGDFGALVKGSWTVDGSFDSTRSAAEWVVDHEAVLPVETVERLTGVDESALVGFVADRLADFPESQPAYNAEHFLVRERGLNWNFRAEDRNRSFVWSHAPLNARPVFEYLLTVPKSQTADMRLYDAVLNELDGDLASLEYAPYGAPLDSFERRAKQTAYELLPERSRIQRAVQRFVLDRDGYPERVAQCLREQAAGNGAVAEYVDSDALDAFAADTSAQSTAAAFDLLTVTTMLEYVDDGELTLERYAAEEF